MEWTWSSSPRSSGQERFKYPVSGNIFDSHFQFCCTMPVCSKEDAKKCMIRSSGQPTLYLTEVLHSHQQFFRILVKQLKIPFVLTQGMNYGARFPCCGQRATKEAATYPENDLFVTLGRAADREAWVISSPEGKPSRFSLQDKRENLRRNIVLQRFLRFVIIILIVLIIL